MIRIVFPEGFALKIQQQLVLMVSTTMVMGYQIVMTLIVFPEDFALKIQWLFVPMVLIMMVTG